jgi:hypothetical protein
MMIAPDFPADEAGRQDIKIKPTNAASSKIAAFPVVFVRVAIFTSA